MTGTFRVKVTGTVKGGIGVIMKKRMVRGMGILLAGAMIAASVLAYAPSSVFAAGGEVAINKTNFPDDNFRTYVWTNFNEDGSSGLSQAEIEKAECVSVDAMEITDLKGIEFLTSVKEIYCGNNTIRNLDLSRNTELEILECVDNNLTDLDVSNHTKLSFLDCDYNALYTLNVSGCTALTELICYHNRLTALDVGTNTALTSLYCSQNNLSSISLNSNTALTALDVSANSLTTLDISKCTVLNSITCYENQLSVLDIHFSPFLMNAFANGTYEVIEGYSKTYMTDSEYICVDPQVTLFIDDRGYNNVVVKFDDIKYKDWFVDAVQYMFDNGLMTGKSATKFQPASPVSREEVTQILYSKEGKPPVSGTSPFSDVTSGKWYANSVIWAYGKQIVAGKSDGTFGVGNPITRQDLAVILYKYAVFKHYDLSKDDTAINGYKDTSEVSSYAIDAMNWAVSQGIISGKGTSGAPKSELRLDPKGNASRAECAAMMKKLFEKN